MYKVMIIDDEKSLRDLLKITIDWKRFGLECCGEASSGIEAINVIDDLKPDIVFVDIKMPFMDGIEFSQIAIKQYPHIKIIILTAMNEFEYARKCVGIGVREYLTKPMVREDVNNTLERIIQELDERQPEPESESDIIDRLSASSSSMNKICEYIRKNYNNSELNLTYAAHKFNFNTSYLSRRFKEDTGMSFIDYLTKCRMERALELAAKQVQMYLTAKEVGIPDPNYFSKCFKKYTGKSYTEVIKELHG
ncbi:response regulator [Ruminococcus sp. HUN007]|uniref:response regulator transcription factor n=1 Tax=Ruminococcus sp. HUN007 TaxID=1514668 RepID=UPI0005D239D6|nr:response regulator [Ruminococcus sp. HUN007]